MKLKKIFYVPGLFSAIIIPLVFWYYANEILSEPKTTIIAFGLPAEYDPNIPLNVQRSSFEPLRNWKYKKIIVEPNDAKANSILFVSEIKKMQQENKQESGIEFVLGEGNSYGDFVSILNDMAKAGQEAYGVDLDKTGHLFAVHFYDDPNNKEELVGNVLCGYILEYEKPSSFTGFTWNFTELTQLPKDIYYIIFGFLIFLNISVFATIKKSIY